MEPGGLFRLVLLLGALQAAATKRHDQDLTLVLAPDTALDWEQINRWMLQGFQSDSPPKPTSVVSSPELSPVSPEEVEDYYPEDYPQSAEDDQWDDYVQEPPPPPPPVALSLVKPMAEAEPVAEQKTAKIVPGPPLLPADHPRQQVSAVREEPLVPSAAPPRLDGSVRQDEDHLVQAGGSSAGDQLGPRATSGGYSGALAGQTVAPDTLVVMLQRLEERLVAAEHTAGQRAALLQGIQHRLRTEEVKVNERTETANMQFKTVVDKLDNLQYDMSRTSTMIETLQNDLQMVQRGQVELKRAVASGLGAGKRSALLDDALSSAVSELNQKLSQLVVNTEILKSGQRRLGGSVSSIANDTIELRERSEDLATKMTVANSLAEMRNYLDRQRTSPATLQPDPDEDDQLPGDCSDVMLEPGNSRSGIYQIRPRGAITPFFVFCDQTTDGGGWTVIQRRFNGEEDFFQDWVAYKYGFGNLGGEFWLGNENIHLVTNHKLNELRVELADFPRERAGYELYHGSNATAEYSSFAVGSEAEGYSLKILDGYSGTAGDSLKYHAGMKFSTKDMDNDLWKEDSCARAHKGGWWYKGCDASNLNGLYLNGAVPEEYEYQVVYWHDWRGPLYSLYKTTMMVRPTDHLQRMAQTGKQGARVAMDMGDEEMMSRRFASHSARRARRQRKRRRKSRRSD